MGTYGNGFMHLLFLNKSFGCVRKVGLILTRTGWDFLFIAVFLQVCNLSKKISVKVYIGSHHNLARRITRNGTLHFILIKPMYENIDLIRIPNFFHLYSLFSFSGLQPVPTHQ